MGRKGGAMERGIKRLPAMSRDIDRIKDDACEIIDDQSRAAAHSTDAVAVAVAVLRHRGVDPRVALESVGARRLQPYLSHARQPAPAQVGKFLAAVDGGKSLTAAATAAGFSQSARARLLWAVGELAPGTVASALADGLRLRAKRVAGVVVQTPHQATLEAVARASATDDAAARVQRRVADLDALAALAVEPVSIPERVKPDGDGWMGRDEVCDALNCSPRTLARRVEAGEVERLQDGRNGLYRVRGASTSQDAATSAPPPAPVLWDVSVKVLGGGVMDLRGASMTINSGGIEISSGGIMVAATLDVLDALNFKRQGGT
jgi:hypothetical protein